MREREYMGAPTIELTSFEMENMAGSEWSVHVLATRRKDGSLTLKVHERSVEYGLQFCYRSRVIRTADAFLDAWVQALGESHADPGTDIERLLLLHEEALPKLARLHPMLAQRVHGDRSVRRAAAVMNARGRTSAAGGT